MSGFAKNGVLYPSGLVSEEYIKNIANECTPLKTVDMLGLDATTIHSIDEILSLLPNASMMGISTNGLLASDRADTSLVGNTFIEKTLDGRVTLITTYDNSVYSGYLNDDNTFGGWNKVCTTRVPDVPKTKINFTHESFQEVSAYYEVNNGICSISFRGGALNMTTAYNTVLIASSLPSRKGISSYHPIIAWGATNNTLMLEIRATGELYMNGYPSSNGDHAYGSFSYPVDDNWRP